MISHQKILSLQHSQLPLLQVSQPMPKMPQKCWRKNSLLLATAVTGNQGTIATPSGSEEKIPDFGMSDDQAAQQDSQVADVMRKNLDYGGTDINNTPKANIFEVLTNRYQRSGMKRLFDENNSVPSEAPSKTEINK